MGKKSVMDMDNPLLPSPGDEGDDDVVSGGGEWCSWESYPGGFAARFESAAGHGARQPLQESGERENHYVKPCRLVYVDSTFWFSFSLSLLTKNT